MKQTRALRSKAGTSAAAVLLSCAGISLTTATPAAAYAGYCNSEVTKSRAAASGGSYRAYIPAYGSNVDCYMNQGADSGAVAALQKNLNWCYGENLDTDGVFGDKTRDALWRAQGEEKIGQDGKYGEQSRKNLKWRWYENRNLWYCDEL